MVQLKLSYAVVGLLSPIASYGFTHVKVGSPLLTRPATLEKIPHPMMPMKEKFVPNNANVNAAWRRFSTSIDNSDIIDADILEKNTSAKRIHINETTTTNHKKQPQHQKQKFHNHGIHPILKKSWSKFQSSIQRVQSSKHKLASLVAAAFIMVAVVFTPLSEAFAAPSGGRMGGSFGGSTRSRSSYSRSYSPPSRSYGGGGYNARSFSRPNIIVAPSIGTNPYSYGYSNYGYGYGPGGVAVVRRGPSIVDIMLFGVFAMVLFNAFSNVSDMTDETSALGTGVSVCQISVALNVPQKDAPGSILTILNRLSRTARTDSRVGVSNLVSQVALELLRQRRSVFAASSKSTHYRDGDKAQRDFSTLAIKERSKFERESTSNYGGVDYVGERNDNTRLTGNTYTPQATAAVVTIILSIDGDSTKLPTINSISDLEQALTRIASDAKVDDCLRSAEVLWTPEDSRDTLSERDVIVDYPELRTIL